MLIFMNFGNLGFGQNYVIYLDMFILNLCTYFYCLYLLNSYMRFYVRLFYVPSSPLSDIISFVELVYQVLQRQRKGKRILYEQGEEKGQKNISSLWFCLLF